MSNNIIPFPRKNDLQGDDDYRGRMRANLAAIAFIAIFLMGSCWVIDKLLSIPTRTDCNFSVRRPCRVNLGANSASLHPSVSILKRNETAN
jgi:hypothetical protein